jgi:hypothetical protein
LVFEYLRTRSAVQEDVPPNPGSFEARASLALKLISLIDAGGLALAALPAAVPQASLYTASWGLATLGIVVVCVVEAFGLDRGRSWAVAAARPVLVLLALLGLALMVVAFGAASFRLPFELVLGAWAWLGPADRKPTPTPDGRSLALLGGVLVLAGIVLLGRPVLDWGGALDPGTADLHATISADCGADGSLPEKLRVVYDWSWSRTAPFASGLDMIVIGWTGADAQGRPLYLLDETPPSGTGIYPGRAGPPSLEMAIQAAAESKGSWRWGVELSEQQLAPGRIEVDLVRARETPPSPEPLTIRATYIHVGRWRSDAPIVTCSW